jgi:hypothetical protein
MQSAHSGTEHGGRAKAETERECDDNLARRLPFLHLPTNTYGVPSPLIKRSPTHARRPTARPERTGRVSKIHPDQNTRFTMARNATGQGSEMRHRLEHQASTVPSQSASRSSPALGGRRGVVRSKDKGKKRAFGWGMGQDGWVEEKFRRFGEHCARNQVGRNY